ncbi:MAG TPA: hypothetical protein VFU55_10940 [Terracidiphilus sp.]|nr:hypothetical protein [Terracidiphilus sp.]
MAQSQADLGGAEVDEDELPEEEDAPEVPLEEDAGAAGLDSEAAGFEPEAAGALPVFGLSDEVEPEEDSAAEASEEDLALPA